MGERAFSDSLLADFVSVQFVKKRLAGNAQPSGCLTFIAACLIQGFEDKLLFCEKERSRLNIVDGWLISRLFMHMLLNRQRQALLC